MFSIRIALLLYYYQINLAPKVGDKVNYFAHVDDLVQTCLCHKCLCHWKFLQKSVIGIMRKVTAAGHGFWLNLKLYFTFAHSLEFFLYWYVFVFFLIWNIKECNQIGMYLARITSKIWYNKHFIQFDIAI